MQPKSQAKLYSSTSASSSSYHYLTSFSLKEVFDVRKRSLKAATMAKRFKLRISKVIPSFHFCRSKNAYRLPISPVPLSVYRLSPLNRKSSDTAYPSFPNPPPSTPISSSEEGTEKRFVSGMVDVGCGGRKARGFHSESCVDSPEWFRRRSHGGGESNDGDVSSTSPLVTKKRVVKRKGTAKGASLKSRSDVGPKQWTRVAWST